MPPKPRPPAPIVSLPMYDWPEVRDEVDRLWSLIAAGLRERAIRAPRALRRAAAYDRLWFRPELLLSQTCGFPYATRLRGTVQLVATPCYAVPGCAGPTYSSVIITRRGAGRRALADLGGATAAVNSEDSQSGHWALRAALAAERNSEAPARVIRSGSHRRSLQMVAGGLADVAAIDAVCWALAKRHEREAIRRLDVIAWSPAAPALPFITAAATPGPTLAGLRRALAEAIDGSKGPMFTRTLFLEHVETVPDKTYDRILSLQRAALKVSFPRVPAINTAARPRAPVG